MFQLELAKASFDKAVLSHLLHGGPERFHAFQQTLKLLQDDPQLAFDPSHLHQSRSDIMSYYAKRLMRFHDFYPLDGTNEELKSNLFAHTIPLSLHGLMFLPTLQNLCDAEQEKVFLEPALRG